ncbi:response regulator transcription factor [Aeromicrobium duanguangcaii]|uniref:Response regulator transcription factor n=1 Tax=Aeromicrobium duanguangcaii TaxID=2968086 RepID=A0ABY5KDW0_9ACTN|nr:response regulator transcription factor [Aeromicrobium duanguangcaii]MCD9154291.1 response regulator transcription factor [Aeromicrobium duanguangcaii]MCL3838037.1 response regulator transcription factor [Aeromicrobium duanguangcaii]UUI68641.1 response regulator transcription factor [Aeromicrobium duanguangcaii]
MIRVVVVDDEEMIRSAIVALLALEEDLDIVGEAANGADGLDLVRLHEPHVVLLDLEMPPTDGIEVSTQIAAPTRSVLMTRHARPGVLRRAMAAGISGFVPKSSPVSTLAQVIREVAAGRRYVDSEVAAAALVAETCPLSDRELDALRLTRRHVSIAEIAGTLHLAEGTVRNYLSSAMAKTDTSSRYEAAEHAYEHGWI